VQTAQSSFQRWVNPRYMPLAMAGLLLIIAASRIVHFATLNPDVDEVWSIWQTFGTPQQILQWTPYDWPPTYYLILGTWKELVGIHPLVLRTLSLLAFLPGVAFFYRFSRRVFNENAALLMVIAYAALSFTVSRSVAMRGYAFAVLFTPMALWLMVRYFTKPTIWRGVWLGLSMAAIFAIHLTAVFAFALIGLFTLVMYPRKLWRWWLPGLIAMIIDWPLIFNKTHLTGNIVTSMPDSVKAIAPFPNAMWEMFQRFTGDTVALWGIAALVATILIVTQRPQWQRIGVLILWLVALPIAVYILHITVIPLFSYHTLWSELFAVGLWIGWGLSLLPKPIALASAIAMMLIMFTPALNSYIIYPRPFIQAFTWLTQESQNGDVMLIDPNCGCGESEMWNYFARVYYPNGLQFVTSPQVARRVWYISRDGFQDKTVQAEVNKGRVARNFVGPWDFLWRLYEAPPDQTGILFENGLRFHGATLSTTSPTVMHEGEPLTLQLWWSADSAPNLNYSIGLYLMTKDGSKLLTQTDGPLQVIDPVGIKIGTQALDTSKMIQSQLYIDQRQLTVPDPIVTGDYALYLVIYDSATGEKVTAPGLNQDKLLFVQHVYVKSW
jgi:hypothetical protein